MITHILNFFKTDQVHIQYKTIMCLRPLCSGVLLRPSDAICLATIALFLHRDDSLLTGFHFITTLKAGADREIDWALSWSPGENYLARGIDLSFLRLSGTAALRFFPSLSVPAAPMGA